MKLIRVFFVLAFVSITSCILAQDAQTKYVTIGVFRIQDNAVRYTNEANKNGFTAQYALNPQRKLYYVYLMSDNDLKKAWNFLMKIRTETAYKDAWIFWGTLGTEEVTVKTEPKVEPKIEPVKEPEKPPVVEVQPAKDTAKVVAQKIDSSAIKKVTEPPVEVKKPKGKPFYFKVVSKTDGKELKGNIQLQEAVGASQYRLIKSGEIVYLEAPVNNRGAYGVITQIPGYKESILAFDYANPQGEKGPQNEDVLVLELDKAKKGDYIDFNNVHFFKNTAIMQPESQNELDALVTLLRENPKYKIKIFGYVNKKQARETLTMGTSTQFFAMDSKANKRATTSSKELSLARAETVKAYLVQQGIDAGRVGTKGEGGSVPLYPEDGTLGERNDRVEVEFVKH